MADAKTALVINGVDRTAGAFASIANRAAACGSQLKGMLGGALAAAGAYMGFAAIKSGINELGHLSDIATKANMSVDDLTQTATAMNVLGIQRMGIDEFAKALDYMQKTTGRVGMEGFYKTVEELSKIEDRSKRGQEAMRIFGRTGMEIMPLINGAAANGVQSLQDVIGVMPAITQSAANSGDACADAMAIATQGVKSVWLQALGAVCGYFDTMFVGGVRGAALMAANWMEYYAKLGASKTISIWQRVTTFFGSIGTFAGAMFATDASISDVFTGDGKFTDRVSNYFSQLFNPEGTIGERFQNAKKMFMDEWGARDIYLDDLDANLGAREAAWRAAYDERNAKIAEFSKNYNNASISANGGAADALAAAGGGGGAAKRSASIRNSLMLGGSNEARKLALLGPQYQTESKKQTKLLEKIAKNTEKKDSEAVELEVVD